MTKIYEVFSWPDPNEYRFAGPKIYHFKDKEIADEFSEFLYKKEDYPQKVTEIVLYDDFETAKNDYELLLKSYKEKKYEN